MNSTPPNTIENVSTFPQPPPFYKLYLNYDANNSNLNNNIEDDDNSTILKPLPPPNPPKEGSHYTLFGQMYSTVDILPSLEELGKEQLYPTTNIEPIKELKKLNRSILFNYLQLLETLIENPVDYRSKVEDISLLFINFHHLLNSYRPHEARETLQAIMMDQINQKNQSQENLKKTLSTCRDLLTNSFKEVFNDIENSHVQLNNELHNQMKIDSPQQQQLKKLNDSYSSLNCSSNGGNNTLSKNPNNEIQIKNILTQLSQIPKPMDM